MYICVAAGSPGSWVTPRDVSGLSLLTTGEETFSRLMAQQVLAWSSGSLRMSYFTARKSETVNSVIGYNSGAAAATPTLCRMGLYTVNSDGSLTLSASCANDPTLFATASTRYVRPLSAPFATVAGQRYATAVLVVTASAMPTFVGAGTPFGAWNSAPTIAASFAGQTDLPSSVAVASLGGSGAMPYMEVSP
jgi:hypothetical protein